MSNKHPSNNYGQYKIRETGRNQQGTVNYSLTVPLEVAQKLKNIKFTIEVNQEGISYKSGIDLKILKQEIGKYEVEDFIT